MLCRTPVPADGFDLAARADADVAIQWKRLQLRVSLLPRAGPRIKDSEQRRGEYVVRIAVAGNAVRLERQRVRRDLIAQQQVYGCGPIAVFHGDERAGGSNIVAVGIVEALALLLSRQLSQTRF